MRRYDFLLILFLTALSCLLLFNLAKKGVYSSHDSQVHIARISQVNLALQDGQLPVRWLNHWNFDYGYPTYVYLYSLPYYIGSLISLAIEDPEIIFKLLIFLSLFLSSITFYIFARSTRFNDKHISPVASGVGAIFYVAAPYRFADIYERGALGEALFFVFAPLLFLGIVLFEKSPFKGFLTTAVSTFALITTHTLSFAILLPMAALFSFVYTKSTLSTFFKFLLSTVFGFALAAYQWIPMIFEQKYVELEKTYFNIYEGNFISTYQLLRIPKEGVNIGTGIQLGSAQIVIILLAMLYLGIIVLRKKPQNLLTIFLVVSTIVSATLTTDSSKQIWTGIKSLQTLIFPWRFLTYTTFSTAVLATIATEAIPKGKLKFVAILVLVFIAIFPSRHYLVGKNWHTYSREFYETYTDPLKLDSYYLPKGANKNLENLLLPQVSIIQGIGDISAVDSQSNQIRTKLRLETSSLVQFHTLYFPGWHLYLNNQEIEIVKNIEGLEGIIAAYLPSGVHKLNLLFQETSLRKTANYITLISLIFLISLLSFKKLKYDS